MTTHTKETLRRIALARRQEISIAEQKQAASAMAENFMRHIPLDGVKAVSGYWPVRGEINVLPLLESLRRKGILCALPRVIDKVTPLMFHEWNAATAMVGGAYGISEPDASSPVVIPDLVLVPLLAFDGKGHRLGYGGGHYDRTIDHLKSLRPVTLVGVSFSYQQYDDVPVESHDHKMDYIVTERTVLKLERR